MKKQTLLTLVLIFMSHSIFSQTHYMTVRVSITHKNKAIIHHMNAMIGNETDHPLKDKIIHVETGSLKISKSADEFIVLHSEVDMITYFDNNGWDLVSVNEVMVIENKVLQYLFKTE